MSNRGGVIAIARTITNITATNHKPLKSVSDWFSEALEKADTQRNFSLKVCFTL